MKLHRSTRTLMQLEYNLNEVQAAVEFGIEMPSSEAIQNLIDVYQYINKNPGKIIDKVTVYDEDK